MSLVPAFFDTDLGRFSVEVEAPTYDILLHLDGADASTTFTNVGDNPATFSATANAQLETTGPKFGSAYLKLDGSGDNIQATGVGPLPATDGWTIDCWVKFTALGLCAIFSYFKPAAAGGIAVWMHSSDETIRLNLSSDGTTHDIANAATTGFTPTPGTWYHLEITRDDAAGKYYFYVDGVSELEVTSGSQVTADIDTLALGLFSTSGQDPMNGGIDEFCVRHYCVHPGGTTFTPPAAPYA